MKRVTVLLVTMMMMAVGWIARAEPVGGRSDTSLSLEPIFSDESLAARFGSY